MSSIKELVTLLRTTERSALYELPEDIIVKVFSSCTAEDADSFLKLLLEEPLKCPPHYLKYMFEVFGNHPCSAEYLKQVREEKTEPYKKEYLERNKTKLPRMRDAVDEITDRFLEFTDGIVTMNKDSISVLLSNIDISKVWNVVIAHPEVLDMVNDDTAFELHTASSPYRLPPLQNTDNKQLLFCITNMQRKYMERFAMVSLVSYMYRCAREFEFYDVDYAESKAVIPELGLLKPDESSCIKNRVLKPGTDKGEIAPDPPAVPAIEEKKGKKKGKGRTVEKKEIKDTLNETEMKTQNLAVKKLIMSFLNHHLEFDPDRHVAKSSKPHKGADGQLLDESMKPVPKDVPNPPFDTFKKWDFYTESNYEKLRSLTNDMYNEKSQTEFAICPLAVVNSDEERENFRCKYERQLRLNILSVNMWAWTLLDSFQDNRDKIKYTDKKMELVEKMLSENKNAEELYESMLRKRVYNKRKQNAKKHGQVDPKLHQMASNSEFISDFGMKPIKDDEFDTFEDIKDETPDDALEIEVTRFSGNIENEESTVEKAKFYLQSEDNIESCNAYRG